MKGFALMVLLTSSSAVAGGDTEKAGWKRYSYSGPRFSRNDCGPALMILDDVLSAVEARNARRSCSWNNGLRADWEALAPYKESRSRAKVSRLMGSLENAGGAGLGALASRKWNELNEGDGPVEARWQAARLTLSMTDLRACNIAAEMLDYLFSTLPVRNVYQTVFCDSYSSTISVSFESLREGAAGLSGAARR